MLQCTLANEAVRNDSPVGFYYTCHLVNLCCEAVGNNEVCQLVVNEVNADSKGLCHRLQRDTLVRI